MSDTGDWWDGFWGKIKHSPAILPAHYQVLPSHVDRTQGEPFRRDQHYFVVKVNQIFLKYDRQFWTTYAPMALVVSEFDYDEQAKVVPFVVGPSLLEKDKIELPSGFVFSDTKVAGIHPYKGGGLKLTVILYQVKRIDLAKKMLSMVERVASVLDFSQTLAAYVKISGVLVDIVETIISSDDDNQPLIGLRKEFDPIDDFSPGYFALIDSRNVKIDVSRLWVTDNKLLAGDSRETAEPFTDANYVLYSVRQTKARDDVTKLGFYQQWKVALAESSSHEPKKWKSARASWASLCQMMSLSPDLAFAQVGDLAKECWAKMEERHDLATATHAKMGAGKEGVDPAMFEDTELQGISERLNRIRTTSVSILD
jgi:hypothetical protein